MTRSRDYGEEIGRRSGGDRAEIGRGAGCGLRVRVRVSSGIRAGVGRGGGEVERVRLRVSCGRGACARGTSVLLDGVSANPNPNFRPNLSYP